MPVTVHPDVAAGLLARTLPGGTYAVVVHAGPYGHKTPPDLADAREALRRWAAQRDTV